MSPAPIEIIGGGLAGLSLGLALARAGVKVTLFEAGDYPRHRVCGEFIAGLDPDTRDALGLEPFLADALLQREIAWFLGERRVLSDRLPAPALAISRHVLDARLAAAFRGAGGELRTKSRVTEPVEHEGRVVAIGRRRVRSSWLGLKVHACHLPLTADLEVHLGDAAYVGLARVDAQTVNVCGLFRRQSAPSPDSTAGGTARHPVQTAGPALLLRYLEHTNLTALAARLREATVDPASFCSVAGFTFDGRVRRQRGIALGDACAMIPPFTGNGMAMAFQSAAATLEPLLCYARGQCSWPESVRAAQAALRRRFRVRLASAAAVHPFLLYPHPQRLAARLGRAHLLPFRPLYAATH